MITNNLFCNARITLKDGTKLQEENHHVLSAILKQQLHTHEKKFALRKRAQKAVAPKAAASKKPHRKKYLPAVVEPVVTMQEAVSSLDGMIRYH